MPSGKTMDKGQGELTALSTPGGNTNPPRSKRLNSDMDPDSPVSKWGLREVLSEFLAPMKEELSSINEFMVTTSKQLDSIGELQEQVIGLKRENESYQR